MIAELEELLKESLVVCCKDKDRLCGWEVCETSTEGDCCILLIIG